MTSIDISLAENPLKQCFAFAPGEKMHIHINFGEEIPERYRLQILDHRNNSRLNRYGRGSDEGIILDWPIPHTIREEHLGIWHVQLEDYRNNQLIQRSFFFVEQKTRIESPLLPSGPITLGLPERGLVATSLEPEHISTVQEEKIPIISDTEVVEEAITVTGYDFETISERVISNQDSLSKIPVTAIKGLGKTYAERLNKIKVQNVQQFFYYPDRVGLAEILRISDTKLDRMLSDADRILKEEEIGIKVISKGTVEGVFLSDRELTNLPGIGPKSVEKLAKLGITSKDDLKQYQDLETLRKTLRMSPVRLQKLFDSIGKKILKREISEEIPIDPLNQPVINLKGIGVKSANKLNSKGVKIVQDLLDSSYDQLKDIITETTYLKWKKNAKLHSGLEIHADEEKISSEEYSTIGFKELINIPGIGPKSVEKLAKLGITSQDELLKYHDLETLRKTLRMSLKRLEELINSLKS